MAMTTVSAQPITRRSAVLILKLNSRRVVAFALIAGLAVACSDGPTDTDTSPLAGLAETEARDSAGNTPTPPTGTLTPGYFHGTVLGQAPPGSGNDSLANMPRISGVVVTAYALLGYSSTGPNLGTTAGTATTGSDGKFQLPTLPGGEYVVTFTPPANSVYRGVWATAYANESSADWPWWVVLPKK
jgi:hypothetical protein